VVVKKFSCAKLSPLVLTIFTISTDFIIFSNLILHKPQKKYHSHLLYGEEFLLVLLFTPYLLILHRNVILEGVTTLAVKEVNNPIAVIKLHGTKS